MPWLLAFVSAFLFGIATPFSKVLLEAVHPFMLAGLFYLGAAMVLVGACVSLHYWRGATGKTRLAGNNTGSPVGREAETEALVARLRDLAPGNLLVVSGASGCGKSSLVKAGLCRALH